MGAAVIPVPALIQSRAWEAAFELRESFAARLTLEQNVRCEVIRQVAPDRLGWEECGFALACWSAVVVVRV